MLYLLTVFCFSESPLNVMGIGATSSCISVFLLSHPIQPFPSVDHRRKGTLSASAPLGCDISRYHRIHVRQWLIGGCDTHDIEVT